MESVGKERGRRGVEKRLLPMSSRRRRDRFPCHFGTRGRLCRRPHFKTSDRAPGKKKKRIQQDTTIGKQKVSISFSTPPPRRSLPHPFVPQALCPPLSQPRSPLRTPEKPSRTHPPSPTIAADKGFPEYEARNLHFPHFFLATIPLPPKKRIPTHFSHLFVDKNLITF